jgi:hypothetical protein
MNDNLVQIQFRWPWTMLPLECADEWIEFIRGQIGPRHPLFGKAIFPSARRQDEDTVLVENDDDGTYVLLSFDRKVTVQGKRMPFTEVIQSRSELVQRLQHDHEVAMDKAAESASAGSGRAG